ncbi:CPBP family intramembrane metalloprotease [Galbitalea sp. SE-J8]|nr:CPBP family intramembrane glutamic endopeptidase [Galbitalea sp. SE-J8]MDM4763355.1 CPBP family intramembrane metalloprotease [Galbitalea sp. SE-J8]
MSRGRISAEVILVLALSLGQSAIYSIVSLIDLSTRGPISSQSTTLNPSQSSRELFDLVYQLLGIAFALVPVALVVFLLWSRERPRMGRLGLDSRRPWFDALSGVGIALVIGACGLAVYVGGRLLGLSVAVQATGLPPYWWSVPVLLLSAFRSGAQEEIIVIGYLYERLRRLGWPTWAIVVGPAVLRGSYHLYQGYSAFIGNALMGVVFGLLYLRTGRLWPLVIAHSLIDAAVFVGYPFAAALLPALFT